jgi:hypothetical protein
MTQTPLPNTQTTAEPSTDHAAPVTVAAAPSPALAAWMEAMDDDEVGFCCSDPSHHPR